MLRSWLFRANTWSVGVDIGSELVKILALNRVGSSSKLLAKGLFRRDDRESIIRALSHQSIKTSSIRVSIDDPSLVIDKVDIPKVPSNELNEVLSWTLKTQLKLPVESMELRSIALSGACGSSDSKREWLTYFALPKESIQKHLNKLSEYNLAHAQVLEPCASALSACVIHNYQPVGDEIYGVLDIGRLASQFLAISSQGLVLYFSLPSVSINALVQSVSHERLLSWNEADDLVNALLLGDTHESQEQIARSFISVLCIKLQEAIDHFDSQFKSLKINYLLLTGGGCFLFNIEKYLSDIFNVTTSFLDPFKRIDMDHLRDLMSERERRLFATAIGLAL